ncbi:MAG: YfhO family protein [Bacteroidetes bacterium]|nr:YfhO family protein [Bacteroidota bacterium]
MNNSLKKIIPHALAVLSFILITLVYFSPLLEGKKLKQADVSNFKGMSKEIVDYREAHPGEEPLWTNSMFSGMPAYQISVLYPSNLVKNLTKVFSFGLPHPAPIVLLCFLGFYFLLLTLEVDILLAVVGALAFGFSSYFLILIEAGHNPKGYAIAYMAPVIAGIIMTYRGKFLLGSAITAMALSLELSANHLQITYYLLLCVALLVIVEIIDAFKAKALPKFVKASAFLVVAALLAVGPNITNLWVTVDYGKYTTRGTSDLTHDKENKTSGLDKDYATAWSYGQGETFSLMIPNFNGGSSGAIGDNKSALEKVDPEFRQYIANVDSYFGNQPFTSGPVYAGALVVFLFVLGLFIVKSNLRWWLLAATVFSILLGWGKNFMPLTEFFLEHFPGYNKFRAVSMILVIAELCIPLLAILAVKEIYTQPQILKEKRNQFYIAFGLTGGLCLLFYMLPNLFIDFYKVGEYEDITAQLKKSQLSQDQINVFLAGVEEARRSIFTADALRSFFFILLGAGVVFAYSIKNFNKNILIGALGFLILVDMWVVDKRYLNKDNFVSKSFVDSPFDLTQANQQILSDKDPNFRVFNTTVSTFNDASTSYFHKSIGGYHGAKLKRYQELIEMQISKNNMEVLNMLNTKYFIVSDEQKQPIAQRNPVACGNAWFVPNYKIVANADSEMAALSKIKPKEYMVVDKKYEANLSGFTAAFDSSATIGLTSYQPNNLVYKSNSSKEQLAVFSEIYYPDGWNAYINGKQHDYFGCNYVLRAMRIPAGAHTIEFKFEPKTYKTGEQIALASSILLYLVLGGALYMEWKRKNSQA